jgi:GTP-binding protein HflX
LTFADYALSKNRGRKTLCLLLHASFMIDRGCRSNRLAASGRLEVNTISTIEGNTQGLKPNQLHRIEKLYNRRIPPHEIVTQEFARQISELSREINRQIGVLVNRNGYVEYLVVGTAHGIVLPDLKRVRTSAERFRGLRCLHTHLLGENLTQDDLTDLALLRLDLMAAIEVKTDGLPGLVRAAHLLPANGNPAAEAQKESVEDEFDEELSAAEAQKPWAFLEPRVPTQLVLFFFYLTISF